MKCFLMMFYELRDAINLVDPLNEAGIEAYIMPIPEVINPDCGYALRVDEDQIKPALTFCSHKRTLPHSLYLMTQHQLDWQIDESWDLEERDDLFR